MKQSHKRSYHPTIVWAFQLQLLPKDLLTQIPRSTKYDWKKHQCKHMFGSECTEHLQKHIDLLKLISHNKQLLSINKALLNILAIRNYILKYRIALKNGRKTIIKTVISRIQSIAVIIGHAKTLKYVGLSYQQWLNFRRLSPCTKSPLQLCRRKHPSQLLNQEINRIVDHCTDTSYAAWPMASIYHNLIRKSLIFCSLSTFYKYAALLVQRQTLPLS